jgi:bifunctional DNA-binding transcriptional regulator/antitoxin component of YhaV-PrlF toxin-antitoxin module
MKIIKMKSKVDKSGQIALSTEAVGNAGLKPGDEICFTMMVQEEVNEHCPLVLITSEGVEITVPLFELQKDDEKFSLEYELSEDELHIPHELLESADISLDSDLEVICAESAIVIVPSDILDRLPDELRGLFEDLGIDPSTVRDVMRKEGYFV